MAVLTFLMFIWLLFHGAHFTYWKNVKTCPTNSKTWRIKTDSFCKQNETYHCIVSTDDMIVETCVYSYTVRGRVGCPQVVLYKGTVFFTPDHTDCPLWNKECPQVNATYDTAELYKYRACLRKLDDRNETNTLDIGTPNGKEDDGVIYKSIFIPIGILLCVSLALAIFYLKRKKQEKNPNDHEAAKEMLLTKKSMLIQPPAMTDVEELKRLKEENNTDAVVSKLEEWRKLPVHIAIIGPSCAGKSTFINKLRGLKNTHPSAAKVGQGNCTEEIMSYCHPNNKKVVFWDVPGYGTDMFPSRKKYLEWVDIKRFDFVLLFFFPTIHSTDTLWVIQQLKSMETKFCLVRSKIDTEMSCEEEHGKSLKDMIEGIKATCREELHKNHISNVQIFAISSTKQKIGEFDLLLKYVFKDMTYDKRESLLYTLGCLTEEVIKEKRAMLMDRAWKAACTMSAATAIPVPGVDHAVCVAALVSETKLYLDTFNLNAKNIAHLPERSLKQMTTASKIFKSGLNDFIMTGGLKLATITVIDQVSTFVLPVIGSLVAGVCSYPFHLSILCGMIDALAKDALIFRILQKEQLN